MRYYANEESEYPEKRRRPQMGSEAQGPEKTETAQRMGRRYQSG